MRNKFKAILVLAVIFGIAQSCSETATAGDGGRVAAGIAAGTLLGLGIAGAYGGPRYYPGPAYYPEPYDYGPGCYPGPRQCEWSGGRCWYNRWGEYICGGRVWHCWRPTVCD
jgi:hypothetical protein